MRERVYDRREMLGDDGKLYPVVEIQELLPVRTKDGTDWIDGMRRLELESGEEVVNFDNRLTIMSTGVVLSEIG